jgi:RNA polymerase sigma-70 factor (ECF subfamily)
VSEPPEQHMDERTLVLRAQDGDVEAFQVLIDRHQSALLRLASATLRNRADAEDVVQETLLTAWRRLHLLQDPGALRSWLLQICSRRATDVMRRGARRGTDPLAPEDLPETEGSRAAAGLGDPFDAVVVDEQMRTLGQLLDGLEQGQRACWVLREIDGLGYAEIAAALDLSESTVRGRLARARAHIIARMEEWR